MHSTLKSSLAELVINRRKTGGEVIRDAVYPTMWRVRRQGGRHSDMVNLTRAMDAAVSWARPRGLGGNEIIRWNWDLRESPQEGPPMHFGAAPLSD